MKIVIKYFAQVKVEAGKQSEQLDLKPGVTLQECVNEICKSKTSGFKKILFDENGSYGDTVVLILNSNQTRYDENPVLNDGDELMLMSPIAGG